MAKYLVNFNIGVEVDMPNINKGEINDVVFEECVHQSITDDEWNDIVSKAVDTMEDVGNGVTMITCIEK